jgi:hypothetical protein
VQSAAAKPAASALDLTDSIMARVDAEVAAEASPPAELRADGAGRVHTIEEARGAKAIRARAPIKAAALVAVSLAIAAGAALLIGTQERGSHEFEQAAPNSSSTPAQPPSMSAAPERVALAEATPDAAELDAAAAIESVDFGSSAGSIFLAEGEGEETTPVVWLVDEPHPDPSRMEPL